MSNILNENISRLWASMIVDEFAKNDVRDFYCAPGMRNAPILAASFYNESITPYSFIDERALSFRALGKAKKEQNPVALTCTSGTAMANFLPAVIEAYRSNLPLIIITADRPIELVKIDANQTINQIDIFKEFCCYTLALEAPSEALTPKRLRTLIATAIGRAKAHQRPVHINLPFREPIDATPELISESYLESAKETFHNSLSKNKTYFFNNFKLNAELEDLLKSATSPLLVFGKFDKQANGQDYIKALKEIDIPKYIDVTSGIKYHFNLEDNLNPSFDHSEVFEAYQRSKPDLIIHIGGRLVSKHYYRYQELNPQIKIIHVTDFDEDHDPGFSNNIKVICNPLSFLAEVKNLGLNSSPVINWKTFTNAKRDIIEENEISFPYLSKNIVEKTDVEIDLLIGNSTAIRSFDLYISADSHYPITVFSNRGVSGIEGFNATLCGLCDADDKAKVLVLGDISFMHDLNSLYMLKEMKDKNITIIIVNNKGGGIFELLPVAKERDFLHLLTTPHTNNFTDLLRAFDYIEYTKVQKKIEFNAIYSKALKQNKINFIEVELNEEINKAVYDKLKTVKM
ncbi:2-succinyl-5-enolpyruvyl-6-hydroxy-3-cyclohexene-1-carboxylic-acid synthase [Bacteriovorax sp. Seq25_V]|uniref:2-succinyl-5-enolpyruvyl-6-hydroxy-3- cyclohexene-1-carboxylic-acid synthase n=1 Tax=Bacteriovorax sp. Seq25_V TaxID=1201288 RepID=UPI00038A1415|nr:2-succinyl-5-enolpyruvyl-6-hydroxy-3-cyclohexene-1-carboxylic-acid synthase [Bacteriovorax sp. Seq25_V]EQC44244.1 2-succinyl-5-enolpyruvyl-6-hydroxy-3-cyclohexene-1-carboxylic-acid synthase [Bacteriovorax sp. Seq25_V]